LPSDTLIPYRFLGQNTSLDAALLSIARFFVKEKGAGAVVIGTRSMKWHPAFGGRDGTM
jgi:hypothetical protein